MKKSLLYIIISGLILTFLLSSCAPSLNLSEQEINFIWKEYHKREFEESFYQKVSSKKRKELMKETAESFKLDYEELMILLKKQNPDKYSKLFY